MYFKSLFLAQIPICVPSEFAEICEYFIGSLWKRDSKTELKPTTKTFLLRGSPDYRPVKLSGQTVFGRNNSSSPIAQNIQSNKSVKCFYSSDLQSRVWRWGGGVGGLIMLPRQALNSWPQMISTPHPLTFWSSWDYSQLLSRKYREELIFKIHLY